MATEGQPCLLILSRSVGHRNYGPDHMLQPETVAGVSLTSWKEEALEVGRPTSSRSASVLRSVGCNAFAKTGLANLCPAEGVLRRWRSIRGRSSQSSVRNGTSLWMRLSRRFISGGSHGAAVRCPAFSLAMASPSTKSLRVLSGP
jgi:hypothetical protein